MGFHQQYRSPASALTLKTNDRDVAFYVQDSWRPNSRITANYGVRVNFVKRHDEIFNVDRENATQVGPRVGVSYMVTNDARNVLRASYGRLYEQTNGRDYITTLCRGAAARLDAQTDKYSTLANGVYDLTIMTPAATQELSGIEFNKNLHNPYVDEFVVGFAKQFPDASRSTLPRRIAN